MIIYAEPTASGRSLSFRILAFALYPVRTDAVTFHIHSSYWPIGSSGDGSSRVGAREVLEG